MLVIRLARVGRKNVKVFRLIAQEKIKSPKRGALEILGHYHPTTDPATFTFDRDKIEQLISQGAIPSPTVARLLSKEGLKDMDKFFDAKKKYNKMTKDPEKLEAMKKAEEEKAAAEAAKNAPAEEKPTEEAPAEKPAADQPEEKQEEKQEEPKEEAKEETTTEEKAEPTSDEAAAEEEKSA